MRLSRLFHVKKSRKYAIKRDSEGKSLRARCFERFEQGQRPIEIAEELGMDLSTAYRYFRDWQRLGLNFKRQYTYVQSLFKKTSPERDTNIALFARMLEIDKEQLENILSRPHGLRRLLTGKFRFPVVEKVDHKLHISLKMGILISNHLVKEGGKFEDVYFAFERWMRENRISREAEDADIAEENQWMAIMHRVLAVDMENERQGRVKPDILTEEERNAILRYGLKARMREVETLYWQRISILISEGLNLEQAREKIYQDLLAKGDVEGATIMREFQNRVHPLKPTGQFLPTSPRQPPSPT